jgi:hypothetical protein
MITVIDGGGMGYGASSDLSPRGMLRAAERARSWARATAHLALLDTDKLPVPTQTGSYRTSVERGWNEWSLEEKIHLLHDASRVLKRSERIVDWQASLTHCESRTLRDFCQEAMELNRRGLDDFLSDWRRWPLALFGLVTMELWWRQYIGGQSTADVERHVARFEPASGRGDGTS